MRVAGGAVTSTDDVNSWLQVFTGLLRPRPPRVPGERRDPSQRPPSFSESRDKLGSDGIFKGL